MDQTPGRFGTSLAARSDSIGRRSAPVSNRARWRSGLQAVCALGFPYLAAGADGLAILGAAVISGRVYGVVVADPFPSARAASVGAVVAVLVVLVTMQKTGYAFRKYLSKSGQASRAFPVWNLAFVAALALGFATKTTSDFSRGTVAVFFPLGFVAVVVARRALVGVAAAMRRTGLANSRRMIAVGFEDRLTRLIGRADFEAEGVDVLSVFVLREKPAYLADDLALAVALVRMRRPDDLCLAIPWSKPDVIEASLHAFLKLPAEVHLLSDSALERFGEAKVARLGAMLGLTLTRAPLTRVERFQKRAFDVVFASAALIALAPLFALVVVFIRCDTRGPALFRQTRYGFNQEPFRIFKFRTMKTMEDGAGVVQATRDDARVTRVGAHLRRLSIDELPQLLNVLSGQMSIVGPRPHAVAHDQFYDERLARYARRHNVKPGITGWAQVRGHRGEISDDSRMQARLDHDLYYIDNWSLWLDIKIVLLTIFSSHARDGAY